MSSDFLFAEGSFLSGMGRVISPFGPPEPYNFSATPEAADGQAMFIDWSMVGQDLAVAIAEFDAPNPDQLALFAVAE